MSRMNASRRGSRMARDEQNEQDEQDEQQEEQEEDVPDGGFDRVMRELDELDDPEVQPRQRKLRDRNRSAMNISNASEIRRPQPRRRPGQISNNKREFERIFDDLQTVGSGQTEEEKRLRALVMRSQARRAKAQHELKRLLERIDDALQGGGGWPLVKTTVNNANEADKNVFSDGAVLARPILESMKNKRNSAFRDPDIRKMVLSIFKTVSGQNQRKGNRKYWGNKAIRAGEPSRAIVKGNKQLAQNRKAQVDVKQYDPSYFKIIGPAVPGTVGNLTGNAIPLYPLWFKKIVKSSQKRYDNILSKQQLNQQLDDKDDPYMLQLEKLGQRGAVWDRNAQKWTGPLVERRMEQLNNLSANTVQRFKASNQLLEKPLSKKQIDEQVPNIVKQIVAANAHLSTSGFGPLKQGKQGLFAGRWIDPVSGNLRMLPRASDKYLNPLSKPQRLSYLQARILNHWNSMQLAQIQYNKVLGQNYKDIQTKKIKRMLNAPQNTGTYNVMISRAIQSYFTQPPNQSAKYLILNQIGPDRLAAIYQMEDIQSVARTDVSDDDEKINIRRIEQWSTAVSQAVQTLCDAADTQLTEMSAQRQKIRIQQAGYNMTMYTRKQFRSGLVKALKAAVIPQEIPAKQAVAIQQHVIGYQQSINDAVKVGGVRKAETFPTMLAQWQALTALPANFASGKNRFDAFNSFIKTDRQKLGINNGPGLIKTLPAKSSAQDIQDFRSRAIVGDNEVWSTKYLQDAKKRLLGA